MNLRDRLADRALQAAFVCMALCRLAQNGHGGGGADPAKRLGGRQAEVRQVPREGFSQCHFGARRARNACGLRVVSESRWPRSLSAACRLLRGDFDDAAWRARRDAAEEDLFRAVAALGGKITGEHGVGWTQRRYLPSSVDAPSLALMRSVKAAFDPQGILNPGKIFP